MQINFASLSRNVTELQFLNTYLLQLIKSRLKYRFFSKKYWKLTFRIFKIAFSLIRVRKETKKCLDIDLSFLTELVEDAYINEIGHYDHIEIISHLKEIKKAPVIKLGL